jgi:hypothetical protein
MQEVLELFSIADETETDAAATTEEQLNLAISQDAVSGSVGSRTMQFTGFIQDVPVRVLVDSGSTTSFLSKRIADQLPSLSLQTSSHKIQIANGGFMHCSEVAVDCSWSMAAQVFTHSLKILPLESYDVILGMDWLGLVQ